MVRELLRLGADPEVRTSRGRTAYDLAAQENKFNSHGMVARPAKRQKSRAHSFGSAQLLGPRSALWEVERHVLA